MKPVPVIVGALLTTISMPSYYYAPQFLSQTVHSFVFSMTGGSTTLNSVSILHQMGYPHLNVVITAFQYLLIGLFWAGIILVTFGLVTKKVPKPMVVKLVAAEQLEELIPQQKSSNSIKETRTSPGTEQVSFEAVNDVLTKLETQLEDIKTGYENHKQIMEDEKKNLEQRERERMAKIIAAGEVLIKEITPDKFEERLKYYIGLKNDETGQPIDLSLLAEKFEKMKKMLDSRGRSDLTPNEFDSFKRFLD